MRLIYDSKLDDNLDAILKEKGDTSVIDAIIQLYKVINEGQLDSTNINVNDTFTQEKWREVGTSGQPAFNPAWVNYGSGFNTCAFIKDTFGFVHLKGLVKSGTTDSTIFTLPIGYKPILRCIFTVMSNDAADRLDIDADGTVHGGNTAWVSLDGITFKGEL